MALRYSLHVPSTEKWFKLSIIIFIARIVGVATSLFTYTWLLYQLLCEVNLFRYGNKNATEDKDSEHSEQSDSCGLIWTHPSWISISCLGQAIFWPICPMDKWIRKLNSNPEMNQYNPHNCMYYTTLLIQSTCTCMCI